MSIFIKGMEMPENCNKCRFQSALRLYCDAMPYNFCGNTDDIERPDFCPLIEVPTPHGRLIDADEFEREFNNHLLPILVKKYGEEEALKGLHFSFRDCICNIQCQKTVIEGSEE